MIHLQWVATGEGLNNRKECKSRSPPAPLLPLDFPALSLFPFSALTCVVKPDHAWVVALL